MEQAAGKAGLRPAWVACLLVALAPAIMAVTTWTPGGYFSIPLYFWRFLAPPVIAIELVVIGIAWRFGYRPLAAIVALPGWIAVALGLLIAIDVGDALFVSPDRAVAMMRSSMTLVHMMFGFAVVHLLRERGFDAYRGLWWALLGGATLYVVIMIAFVLSITQPYKFDWLHFGLGVVNIRHAGFYVALGMALALGIAATEARLRFYGLATGAATLCAAELFWSGSRAPLLSVSVACFVGAALIPALRTARLLVAWTVGMAAGAALSLLHTPPYPNYGLLRMIFSGTKDSVNEVASGRFDLWLGSMEAFLRRPLLGYGESQYIIVVPQAQAIYYHPHNAPLQLLVQWGGVGTLLFAILAAFTWWKLFRGTKLTGDRALPAFLAVNTFIIYAMFDGVMFFVYPMMILAFLFAAGLAAAEPASAPSPASA